MFASTAIGRSLSCAIQRLLPKSRLLSTPTTVAAQCASRFSSYRSKCAQNVSKQTKPKDSQCTKKETKKEQKKDKKKSKSMWLNPECCLDPCPDLLPRYDDLHYKPSDKLKRKYTQTWVECPKVRIAAKKICCHQKVIPPPFKRRIHKRRTAAQECKPRPTNLMPCKSKSARSKCPKIMLPGCNPARSPPKCKRETEKSDCRKICTPYPSYSECSKKRPRPVRSIECRCLDVPSWCEVWEELRRQATIKKVSNK